MMKRILLFIVAVLFSSLGWSQMVKVKTKGGTVSNHYLKDVVSIGFKDETQPKDYSVLGKWEVVYCRYLDDFSDENIDGFIGTTVEFFDDGKVSFMGKTRKWTIGNNRIRVYAPDNTMIEDNKILLLDKENLNIFINVDFFMRYYYVKLKRVSY